MASRVITLLTDFGLRDPYVAEMKGVILNICPSVNIVDISHDIEKFNIRMGSYVLASSSPYFPKGTINVAVVDPGVGTERRGLCVETERGFFVGPDNGLLALAARAQKVKHIYVIENTEFLLSSVSPTFHGRDVFASVAAHLAKGTDASDFGPKTRKMIIPAFAKVVRDGSKITGEVMNVDGFGNVITNITEKDLESFGDTKELGLKVGRREMRLRFCKAYGNVGVGRPLALVGGQGFLEISVNQGDASKVFGLKSEDKITVCL
jgi:S-adenosylmethionine hydrolase